MLIRFLRRHAFRLFHAIMLLLITPPLLLRCYIIADAAEMLSAAIDVAPLMMPAADAAAIALRRAFFYDTIFSMPMLLLMSTQCSECSRMIHADADAVTPPDAADAAMPLLAALFRRFLRYYCCR